MQFDVYRNENSAGRKKFQFLLDVQADVLDDLEFRLVIPLAARESFPKKLPTLLMPVLRVCGQEVVAVTYQMAGISRLELRTRVDNVSHARREILAALDFMITGV